MDKERASRKGEIDPAQAFVLGADRVSLNKILQTKSPYIEAMDRVLAARGNPQVHNQEMVLVKQISEEAAKLALPNIVAIEFQKALEQVPEGAEGNGKEISKVLMGRAFKTEVAIQHKLYKMGEVTAERRKTVSGWSEMELVRLAVWTQEVLNPDGPRQEVLDGLKPVAGQINNEKWDANMLKEAVVEARRARVEREASQQSGSGEEVKPGKQAEEPRGESPAGGEEKKKRSGIWGVLEDLGEKGVVAAVGAFAWEQIEDAGRHLLGGWKERDKARIAVEVAEKLAKAAEHERRAAAIRSGEIPFQDTTISRSGEVVQPGQREDKLEKILIQNAEILKNLAENQKKQDSEGVADEKPEKEQPKAPQREDELGQLVSMLKDAIDQGGKARELAVKEFFRMTREEVTETGACGNCGSTSRSLGSKCSNCGAKSRVAELQKMTPLLTVLLGDVGERAKSEREGSTGQQFVMTPPRVEPGSEIQPAKEDGIEDGGEKFFTDADLRAWGIPLTAVDWYSRESRGNTVNLLNRMARTGSLLDQRDTYALNGALTDAERKHEKMISKGLLETLTLAKALRENDPTIANFGGKEGSFLIMGQERYDFSAAAKLIESNPDTAKMLPVLLNIAYGDNEVSKKYRKAYSRAFAGEIDPHLDDTAAAEKWRGLVAQDLTAMKEQLAEDFGVSKGAVEVVSTWVMAWGGDMGSWKWKQTEKRFPIFAGEYLKHGIMDNIATDQRFSKEDLDEMKNSGRYTDEQIKQKQKDKRKSLGDVLELEVIIPALNGEPVDASGFAGMLGQLSQVEQYDRWTKFYQMLDTLTNTYWAAKGETEETRYLNNKQRKAFVIDYSRKFNGSLGFDEGLYLDERNKMLQDYNRAGLFGNASPRKKIEAEIGYKKPGGFAEFLSDLGSIITGEEKKK